MTRQDQSLSESHDSPVQELTPDRLRRPCDLDTLDFETSGDLQDLQGLLGQPRAVAAVEFGIGIDREGFNVFAFGAPGTGKHSAVQQFLLHKAADESVPPDTCYVNNFDQPHCPRLLVVPAGRGVELRQAMSDLITEVTSVLETALESEEYQSRKQVLEQRFEDRQAESLSKLGELAGETKLALVKTPVGIVFAPVEGEEVLSPEKFQCLPDDQREQIEENIEEFKERLQLVLQQFPRWQREASEALRQLHLEVSRFAVGPLFDDMREVFVGLQGIQEYLDAAQNDVIHNAQRLIAVPESTGQITMDSFIGNHDSEKPFLRRYRVNVIVNHGGTRGAPVVYEDNPTYQNLVGRIEHIPQMGAAVTDFGLIKPGALHRANGGYLLIDALKLLSQPYAYEGLKRALEGRTIKIESVSEAMSLMSTYSLEPEPTALAVKIVLLGSPSAYHLLSQADPDFTEYFKVAADFAGDLEWTDENQILYARLLAKLAREEQLRPFDRSALCQLIEQSARSLGDSKKLSLLMSRILDVMREADYWAGYAERECVTSADIQAAVDAARYRSDRIRERVHEQILRDTVLLDTSGDEIGQVNGLSVLQIGDFAFGNPTRITARVRLGTGDLIDIEREVKLSGPIHSKGVLILSGFLGGRFAADQPLSLTASLVFEQSYSGVDGDSASSTELYALLSAISAIPIKQSLAVTGSVNQLGQVQAIGGVNEKIEGFFEICAARGLTGDQGVLIPQSNVEHLMLEPGIIEAVSQGLFHIYPVSHIDEGIELLTGVPAGRQEDDGTWPEGTVNSRVATQLAKWAEAGRAFGHPPPEPKSKEQPE
jgi:lon-related putative ATP-dependent protease